MLPGSTWEWLSSKCLVQVVGPGVLQMNRPRSQLELYCLFSSCLERSSEPQCPHLHYWDQTLTERREGHTLWKQQWVLADNTAPVILLRAPDPGGPRS